MARRALGSELRSEAEGLQLSGPGHGRSGPTPGRAGADGPALNPSLARPQGDRADHAGRDLSNLTKVRNFRNFALQNCIVVFDAE